MRTASQYLGLEDPDLIIDDRDELDTAFDIATAGTMTRIILNDLYFLCNTRTFRLACQRVRNLANASVRRVLSTPIRDINAGTSQQEKRNLLEEFVLHTRDQDRLSNLALDMLFAARQTTASFVSSTLLLLARHPVIYAKLRQHVVEEFGAVATDDLIGFEDLKQCKYLQWCMNEALRLIPPVTLGLMTATEDVILPSGGGSEGLAPVFLSKVSPPDLGGAQSTLIMSQGTTVAWSFYMLHRDPKFWGDDVEQYRPERFEHRQSWKGYLPFNAGPVSTLGRTRTSCCCY